MKVLGIGEAVVDATSTFKKNCAGVALDAKTLHRDAGGPVIAALVLLAKLGANCHMVTSLGDDDGGDLIRGILGQYQIALTASGRQQTKQHAILVDAHTGQRKKYRSGAEHAQLAELDPAFVQTFDLIIVDRHEPMAFYDVLRSKRPDTHLIVDPSTELSAFTKDMMRHSSHPVVPIETLALLSPAGSLRQALAQLHHVCRKSFVVTLGELGCLIYDGTNLEIVQPLLIEAVDTCGAGDVYRGGFAYGLLRGWSLRDSAAYANIAAALQCTEYGNASVVPSKAEIETYRKQRPKSTVTTDLVQQHLDYLRRQYGS